jgi:prepilin-type N-terminal cleavage/methylation domain-containing protein
MRRNRPAFTIIELLTVMAILSLLMAILLPTLSAARRAAKANACLSNLKGIGTSFVVYLNENEDFFPPAQLNYASPTDERIYVNGFGRGRPRWHWFLETDHGPVVDPGPFRWITAEPGGMFLDNTTPRGSSRTGPREIRVEVFVCPGLDDERYARDTRDGAYGYNYQYRSGPAPHQESGADDRRGR